MNKEESTGDEFLPRFPPTHIDCFEKAFIVAPSN